MITLLLACLNPSSPQPDFELLRENCLRNRDPATCYAAGASPRPSDAGHALSSACDADYRDSCVRAFAIHEERGAHLFALLSASIGCHHGHANLCRAALRYSTDHPEAAEMARPLRKACTEKLAELEREPSRGAK